MVARNQDVSAFFDRRQDVTPESHPDHHVVGLEFGGHDFDTQGWPGVRWFCVSHDAQGYWMFATDGSGHFTNVSERAIGRSFHEIHKDPDGHLWCTWFGGPVPRYKAAMALTTS